MNDEEKRIRRKLRDNFEHYALKCLKIRSKSGKVEPLVLNRAQKHIHALLEKQRGETGKVRAICLKGRQQGCSSYVGARFYHKVCYNFGIQAFILTHALDATQNLYKMAQRYYENTPTIVRPAVTTSNAKELIFGGLDSGYKLGTAENKSVGRSATIQLLHASECAFWNNAAEHAKGIFQAVPNAPGTEIIIESTANGIGNFFHEQWQKAEAGLSEFIAIFVPWYWQDEYTMEAPWDFIATEAENELKNLYGLTDEQLCWRRVKIAELSVSGIDGEKAFLQEYPCTAQEAFQTTGEDTYIDPSIVMRARKADVEKVGKMVIGVDPARFGDDRTAIIRRRGRVAYGLETYIKKDTMEITGIVHKMIEELLPTKVFVDVGGLGAGIVDRLFELGHRDVVVPVNAGSSPLDGRKYANKRSEMWGELKAWLSDGPVQIPDDDALHADLCGIRYKIDSNSRLVMEQKSEMKKRGIRSPDTSDALCFEAGTLIQTPLGKIRIENLKIGDEVSTPFGKTKICKTWISETSSLTTVTFSNGSELKGKGEHKIFTWNNGVCRMDALELTSDVEAYSRLGQLKWACLKPLLTKTKSSEFRPLVDTIVQTTKMRLSAFYIVAFGQKLMDLYQKSTIFITWMGIGATTTSQISNVFWQQTTKGSICWSDLKIRNTKKKTKEILMKRESRPQNGMHPQLELNGIKSMGNSHGSINCRTSLNVPFATTSLSLSLKEQNSAQGHADKKDATLNRKHCLKSVCGAIKRFWLTNIVKSRAAPSYVRTENVPTMKVYNLTLEKHNAYYANGILVYNCLTFAQPSSALESSSKTSKLAGRIMSNQKAITRARNMYGTL